MPNKNKIINMKKILICTPNNCEYGGVQNYIYNTLKNINTTNFSIELYFSGTNKNDLYNKQFNDLNIKTYFGNNTHIYKSLYKLLKTNHYDIIHIQTGYLRFVVTTLLLSFFSNIKIRIAHSHSSANPNLSLIHKLSSALFRFIICIFSNKYIACSDIAGKWMFGKNKKFEILKNGIEIEKYLYTPENRSLIRKQYNIKHDEILLGLVANFILAKNHDFLIELFKEYKKATPKAKLLLIGQGELKESIIEKVNKYNLSDSVIFAGSCDSSKYYSAFDLFIMTSLYEGLPFVALEAQASACPCLLTDVITTECKITDFANFISSKAPIEEWIKSINTIIKKTSDRHNFNNYITESFSKAGYNIKNSANRLAEIYSDI